MKVVFPAPFGPARRTRVGVALTTTHRATLTIWLTRAIMETMPHLQSRSWGIVDWKVRIEQPHT